MSTQYVNECIHVYIRKMYCLSINYQVSLPKVSTTGEYAPLKFNFESYTCDSKTDGGTGERLEAGQGLGRNKMKRSLQ